MRLTKLVLAGVLLLTVLSPPRTLAAEANAAPATSPTITWIWTSCECGSDVPWRRWRVVVNFDGYSPSATYRLAIRGKGRFRVQAGQIAGNSGQVFLKMGRAGLKKGHRYRFRLIKKVDGTVTMSRWRAKRLTTNSQPFPS